MDVNLQIENGFAALNINPLTAIARYTEGVSTSGWGEAAPERIIQRDQTIDFTVTFDVSGLMQTLFTGCKWRASLFLERYGGPEYALPFSLNHVEHIILGSEAVVGPVTYTLNFPQIPANTIPPGVYDLVCMVRLVNPSNLPLPVAMFGDFETVEVYVA